MRVGLVACTKTKLTEATTARRLYSASDLFRKASAYCEARCDAWYILSAKYGLIGPGRRIAPYDVTLKTMSSAERREWGERVAKRLRQLGDVTLEVHAGREYVWPLEAAGVDMENPLAGLSIGRRKRWYIDHMPGAP